MKNKISFAVAAVLMLLTAPVFGAGSDAFTFTPDPNTTNVVVSDCRRASGCSVIASGTATVWYSDAISVTNTPSAVNGLAMGIAFNGSNYLYVWTNNPPVTNSVIVQNVQITIGVTNGDTGTAGNAAELIFGNTILTYPVISFPNGSQIAASVNSNLLATNCLNFFSTNFPAFTYAWVSANVFTITTANLGFTGFGQIGADFTNLVTMTYTTNTTVTTPPVSGVGLTGGVLAMPRTRVTIGVTNATGDAGTSSNSLVLTLGSASTYYVITNNPGAGQILASNTPTVLATNIYNFLASTFPSFTLAWSSSQIFTVTTLTNDNLSLTNLVSGIFTNTTPATVYLGTNYVSTNQYNIVAGTNPATSATNLSLMFNRDFPSIKCTVSGTNLTLTTYGLPLGTTNGVLSAVGWGTATTTTNAGVGNVVITAAVGNDLVNWFGFPALNLTFVLSTNGGDTGTNAALNGWKFVQWTVGNVATNGACPNFKLMPSSY